MMNWGNFSGMGYGGFGLGWIFMILFWALVILGIVYLLKSIFGSASSTEKKETALDILKKRYASGEISEDEYNKKYLAIKAK
jgi:putative membrane protein